MKHSKIISIILILINGNLYSQSLQKLKLLILNADSVILTSHISPPSIITGLHPNDYKLVLNGKVNPKFVKERKRINKASKIELANFLTYPFRDSIIEESNCFFYPHHSIYIFKHKRISYIHICFRCEDIECSRDINLPINDFDRVTWKKMEDFLKAEGFKYGFNEDDP
jgi:hypothetical protein